MSQRRWTDDAQNKHYHAGQFAVDRVREWRREHPGYWRRRSYLGKATAEKGCGLGVVLREFALQDSCGALQDSWPPLLAAIVGLVARLGGDALQETIARELRKIMVDGNDILQALSNPTTNRRRSLQRVRH